MKKLLLSVVAMATAMNLMAAPTASVKITMTGEGSTSTLLLIESADYTSAFENGYDAPAAPGAEMYATLGGSNLSQCWTNNLDEVEIRFASAGTYTLTFSGISGRQLKLWDGTNDEVPVTATTSMVVTVTDPSKFKVTVNDPNAAPAAFEVCHRNNHITIQGNKNTENIVIKVLRDVEGMAEGDVVYDEAPSNDINLTGYKKGYYTIEGLDQDGTGKALTIKVE